MDALLDLIGNITEETIEAILWWCLGGAVILGLLLWILRDPKNNL